MTTIYTPRDSFSTLGEGWENEDWSDFGVIEEMVSPTRTDEEMENLVALVVTDDGRVFYHYALGADGGSYTSDLISMTGPYQETFERIIDDHRLNITTCQSDLPPFLFDLALTPTTVLPTGAEVCAPEVLS